MRFAAFVAGALLAIVGIAFVVWSQPLGDFCFRRQPWVLSKLMTRKSYSTGLLVIGIVTTVAGCWLVWFNNTAP